MRFDDAHEWAGDALPAPESNEFQQGKYEALLKLAPYAREGSREAAAVVLKLDGSEFYFGVGEIDRVSAFVPAREPVAHLYTHADEWAQSEVDWSNFLLASSVEQAHVITPLRTYSLHKPVGWKMPLRDGEGQIQRSFLEELKRIADLSAGWSPTNERCWREETNLFVARRYNINFREGTRL